MGYTFHGHVFLITWPSKAFPFESELYLVKLGYTVSFFFLLFIQNTDCGYSLEPFRQGSSNVFPQSVF